MSTCTEESVDDVLDGMFFAWEVREHMRWMS